MFLIRKRKQPSTILPVKLWFWVLVCTLISQTRFPRMVYCNSTVQYREQALRELPEGVTVTLLGERILESF